MSFNISKSTRRVIVTGFIVGGIMATMLRTGAVHAQDNDTGGGTPCVHDGTIYGHGDTVEISGTTYVCQYGRWVAKAQLQRIIVVKQGPSQYGMKHISDAP